MRACGGLLVLLWLLLSAVVCIFGADPVVNWKGMDIPRAARAARLQRWATRPYPTVMRAGSASNRQWSKLVIPDLLRLP